MEIIHVGESDFKEEVTSSGLPVLVNFTAVWCGPCKMLEPIVEELAQEWEGKVKIVKLDVDKNSDLAMQYQIMGVPTLILFSNGEPLERMSGYQPKQRIKARIGPYL